MTFVIAMCGTMGSGKTTAVENISAALPDCEMLFEDDYNRTTERSLSDIDSWWERGANVGEFDLSDLLREISRKCPERSHPQRSARPDQRILLVETHFGRLHPELSSWIDFQCWIDVPADIAVARKVAQLSHRMQKAAPDTGSADGLRWIENFCKGYLTTTRKLFEMQRQKVRELSDLSIDGEARPLDVCAAFLRNLPKVFLPGEP